MSDIKQRIIFNDDAVIKGLTNQHELLMKVSKAIGETEAAYKEAGQIAQKQLADTNAAVSAATQKVGAHIVETNKATKSSSAWGDALEGVAGHINVMGQNLGGVITGLKAKAVALQGATKGIAGMITGLRTLKIALLTTGIGALVVLLGAVAASMGRSERVTNSFAGAMKTLGGMATFVRERFASLGDAVRKTFSGDHKGAIESWTVAMGGFWKGLNEAGMRAAFLAKELKALNAAASEETVTNAIIKGQVADLLLQAADRNKSLQTRIDLLREAEALEIESAKRDFEIKRKFFLNKQLELAQQIREGTLTDDQRDSLNALKVAALNAETAMKAVAKGYEKSVTTMEETVRAEGKATFDERQAQIKAVKEAYLSLINNIEDAANAARLDSLDPSARIAAEEQIALATLEGLKDEAEAFAKANGKKIDIEQSYQDAKSFIIKKALEAQKKLLADAQGEEADRINAQIDLAEARQERADADRLAAEKNFQDRLAGVIAGSDAADALKLSERDRLKNAANNAILLINIKYNELKALAILAGKEVDLSQEQANEIKAITDGLASDIAQINPFKEFAINIGMSLGLSEKEAEESLKHIGSIVGTLYESMTAATGAAIEKNKELIESLKEQEEEANDQLEKELERQSLGLANDVEGERKRIETIKKQREAAEKEAEKLRKKQVAAQLVADGLSQASSIITMVTNVTKGTSIFGPAGIPIALATIAAFLAIISSIKASQQKKLYKGGPIDQEGVTGFVSISGRTDKGEGKGHKVEGSNLVLGGREFVVNESAAMKHRALLESINDGEFTGKNLADEVAARGLHFAMGHNKEHQHNSEITQALSRRNSEQNIALAIKQGVSEEIGKLIKVIESKPDTYSYTPGDIVVREKDGEKRIIETAKDWRWTPEKKVK